MDTMWKFIGNITVSVFQFSEQHNFYYIKADNEDILPVLDAIENTLYEH